MNYTEAEIKRRLAEADIKNTQAAIARIDEKIADLQRRRAELLMDMLEAQAALTGAK